MRPIDPAKQASQTDLFRNRLENIISLEHALVTLSESLDWEGLEQEFGQFYVEEIGRPGIAIRVMVGLLDRWQVAVWFLDCFLFHNRKISRTGRAFLYATTPFSNITITNPKCH